MSSIRLLDVIETYLSEKQNLRKFLTLFISTCLQPIYVKFFVLMAAFQQTLRHMCLVKIAIIFIYRFDWFIYKYVKHYCLSEVDKNSRELAQIITEQISGEVLQLLPAKSLRDDFLKMFEPLCYQILYFYASPSLHKPAFSLSDICWNSDGTLDTLRTLKNLLQNPDIIHPRPFLIAWDNCMQDDFKRLWYEMNECQKADVAKCAKEYGIKIEHAKKCNIHSCHSKRKIPRTEVRFSGSIYSSVRWFRREEDLYARSYNSNMTPALKCLLGKLTLEMKKDKLESLFISQGGATFDVFNIYQCFLNEKERIELVKNNLLQTLIHCLDWPRQNFFFKMLDTMWDNVKNYEYCALLKYLLCAKIYTKERDFDYFMLFVQLWHICPAEYKDYIKKDKMFDYMYMLLRHSFDPYVKGFFPERYQFALTDNTSSWMGQDSDISVKDFVNIILFYIP
ncbi:uncharacterized protein CDAR_226821 [Caerostris darwini]|uniref:Mab-21-like HhH/H2TH-like domain-containing protein n=1 Tax=Caerostris darwini TaxID=1538125 RepID=A0AAV4UUM9_9ARAC|nr:uncharacterized protein CDAR_226821 [Caerostris darwini]